MAIDNRAKEERIKIRELQQALRQIAIRDTRVPILSIDGYYLDDTVNSVKAFQQINGFKPTGEADEETWKEIFRQYREIRKANATPTAVNIFKNPDATLQMGAEGYTIYFVQTILKALSEKYYNIGNVEITGVYDAQTELAIKNVRKATGANLDEGIDKNTFEALTTLFNAAEK